MPRPKPPCKLAFVDVETTGLDPERHEVFEVAVILRDESNEPPKQPTAQYTGGRTETDESIRRRERWQEEVYKPWAWEYKVERWIAPDHLQTADSTALRLNRYYERIPKKQGRSTINYSNFDGVVSGRADTAKDLAVYLDGAHLVGFNPSFDARFLEALLRQHGCAPSWHYHLIDVEMLMLAHLGQQPPFKSDDLVRALGVEVPKNRHSAMADARLASDCYDEVIKAQKKLRRDLESLRRGPTEPPEEAKG